MRIYRIAQFQERNEAFEDMFGDMGNFDTEERSKVVKIDPIVTKPYQMTLYRGFDADINGLERQGDSYILSPKKCEQGVLRIARIKS